MRPISSSANTISICFKTSATITSLAARSHGRDTKRWWRSDMRQVDGLPSTTYMTYLTVITRLSFARMALLTHPTDSTRKNHTVMSRFSLGGVWQQPGLSGVQHVIRPVVGSEQGIWPTLQHADGVPRKPCAQS